MKLAGRVKMKCFPGKLGVLVYRHRYCTPEIFEQLKFMETDLNIKVFIVVKDLISTKKQKDTDLSIKH